MSCLADIYPKTASYNGYYIELHYYIRLKSINLL